MTNLLKYLKKSITPKSSKLLFFRSVKWTQIFREKYTHSVGLQAEVNELTAEEMELDILIEQEEKRIKELTDVRFTGLM